MENRGGYVICETLDEYQALNEAIFAELNVRDGVTTHYAPPNPKPDADGKYRLPILPEVEGFACLQGKTVVDDSFGDLPENSLENSL